MTAAKVKVGAISGVKTGVISGVKSGTNYPTFAFMGNREESAREKFPAGTLWSNRVDFACAFSILKTLPLLGFVIDIFIKKGGAGGIKEVSQRVKAGWNPKKNRVCTYDLQS